MIKVSDYIIKFLEVNNINTAFCITGGAAAHLMESIRESQIKVYHNYHEQACAMAAEGYARITNNPALVLVTNGPGSSNTITGVIGAWQDSLPMIVISGQVPTHQTLSKQSNLQLRQLGLQEADIISMVKHCTKFAIQCSSASDVPTILEHAYRTCISDRMGPVWIDVPIDIQAELLDIQPPKAIAAEEKTQIFKNEIETIKGLINKSKKPLVLVGNGVHLAKCESSLLKFINSVGIPVVSTWNASDIFNYVDNNYVGNFGLLGERVANYAVQNCDLLLCFGSRLSIPCTGYNTKDFAKNAYKVVIDIDDNELKKSTLNIDLPIVADLRHLMQEVLQHEFNSECKQWKVHLTTLKTKHNIFEEPHSRVDGFVNSFDFMNELSKCLVEDDIVVTDMGTSFTCTMQALRNIGKNRLFTSSALCSMGFGLPGAIGAYMGNPKARVICIAGDGGFQMNVQELQTVKHHQLPIKIIILNNNGYLAISLMQDNLFDKKRFGADTESGVSSPDFCNLANAYGIKSYKLQTLDAVKENLHNILNSDGPCLIEVNMVRDQLLIPRVQSKKDATGKIVSGSLDTMFPFKEL